MHRSHPRGTLSPRQLIRLHQRATTRLMGLLFRRRHDRVCDVVRIVAGRDGEPRVRCLSVARFESATAQTTCDPGVNDRSLTGIVGLKL